MHNAMSNIKGTTQLNHQSNEADEKECSDNHAKSANSSTSTSGYPRLSTSYIEAAAAAVAAESSEKKRKRAVKESKVEDGLLDEVKQRNRLAANRRSAALSRQRKRDLIESLQQTVAKLSKENLDLKRKCELLEQELQRYQSLPFHQIAESLTALKNNGNDGTGGHLRFGS